MEGACKEHTSLTDKQKLTSLVAAAELGHIRCIEKLLKAGADVNAVDGNGYSALIQATENNFNDIVSILLQAGADVNMVDNYGDTALIHAAENGYDECLKLLIDGGADVNVTDSDGDAAASLAVLYGHDKCLRLLIGAGVDVNSIKTTKTLTHEEIIRNEQGRVRIPRVVPVGSPLLLLAVYEGFDKCVNLLIEAGADVNVLPQYGEPAVVFAVRKAYPKCVAALVAAGADVTIKQDTLMRYSAIDCAIERSDPEILKLLLVADVAEDKITAALRKASSHHESQKWEKGFMESHLAANREEETDSSYVTRENIFIENQLQKIAEEMKASLECMELLLNHNGKKTDKMTAAAQVDLDLVLMSDLLLEEELM